MNPSTTIESTVQVGWQMPYWLIIVVSALFFSLVAWIYWSERGSCPKWLRGVMVTLRFSLFALVLWMLAGWSWQRSRTEPPELVIAIDVSDSMLTADGVVNAKPGNSLSRLQRAEQLLARSESQLTKLQQDYQLRLYVVADDAMSAGSENKVTDSDLRKLFDSKSWEMSRTSSRLGDSLTRIIERQAGRGTAAIVLVSDGITTSGTTLIESGQRARRAAIPIHTVTLGRQVAQPDLRITDLLAEQQVYFGDRVNIDASVVASDLSATKAKVSLIDVSSGRVLDQQSLALDAKDNQKPVSLGFVPDKPGEIRLKVSVEELPDEGNMVNNHAELTLTVQNRSIKVLLVFGGPSYEFRFLKHFLERTTEGGPSKSATFELKSVLQEGDLDYILQDSSAQRFVPTEADELAEFDVFVFGQFDPNIIPRSAQQAIVRAVTSGGAGCMFAASEASLLQRLSSSPLSSLLPVESANRVEQDALYEFAATKLGQSALPLQWSLSANDRNSYQKKLPAFQTVMRLDRLKPGAQVLAEAVSADGLRLPLLVSQFAGAGRTVMLATDETYRWTGAFGSDAAHQLFWGQTLRWLSRGKLNSQDRTELTVEPKQAGIGTPLRINLRMETGIEIPETATVQLTNADGFERTEILTRVAGSPNLFQVSMNQLPAGDYRAVLVLPTLSTLPAAVFNVIAPPGEQANLRADVDAMQQLARLSRGKSYDGETAGKLLEELPAGRPTKLGSLPPLPIWNSTWVAVIFLSLITAEWLLRRHARML
jgi:hypothetical protein